MGLERLAILGSSLKARVEPVVTCKICGHQAKPDIAEQVAHLGAGLTLLEWAAGLPVQNAIAGMWISLPAIIGAYRANCT